VLALPGCSTAKPGIGLDRGKAASLCGAAGAAIGMRARSHPPGALGRKGLELAIKVPPAIEQSSGR